MYILNNENKAYNLDELPDEIDDIRYCIYDALGEIPDYYFLPLVFVEQFNAPAALLQIGNFRIQMPLDWSVVVVDEELTSAEIMPIISLNDKNLHTIVYNPLAQMIPDSFEIKIANIFNDVNWFFPKLKQGSILCVPLETKDKPRCALFVQDRTKLQSEFDLSQLFE
jgi:hypothetical protein